MAAHRLTIVRAHPHILRDHAATQTIDHSARRAYTIAHIVRHRASGKSAPVQFLHANFVLIC